jgi:hypothetical protein
MSVGSRTAYPPSSGATFSRQLNISFDLGFQTHSAHRSIQRRIEPCFVQSPVHQSTWVHSGRQHQRSPTYAQDTESCQGIAEQQWAARQRCPG